MELFFFLFICLILFLKKEYTVLYKTSRVYPRVSKNHKWLCESPVSIPFSLNLETCERAAAPTKGGVTPAPVPVSVSDFWPSSNTDTGTGTFALVSLVPVLALVPAPSQQKEPLYCVKNLSKLCFKHFPKSA